MTSYTERMSIALVGAVVLVLAPIFNWPYAYYVVLRYVVVFCALYMQMDGQDSTWISMWNVVFGILVLLFNPVFPVYLPRSVWRVVDFSAAILMVVFAVTHRLCGAARVRSLEHTPEVMGTAPQKPNLVLDDNMELRPEMGFMRIVGTVTNGGATSIDGGILITFSLFDAQKNPMGTASDYLCKGSTVAPGVSWRYDCVCMRNDAEKVVKATVKNLAIE